jgi:hypothetical protein
MILQVATDARELGDRLDTKILEMNWVTNPREL